MTELLPKLAPLLIVDVLNPVLFALMLVAVGSAKPLANSVSLLAGHTAAYFASGIVVALGIEKLTQRLNNPLPIDFAIGLVLGILLLWSALGAKNGKATEDRTPEKPLSPMFCFGYGAVVNFIGVPFALPYFAAIDQILKADLAMESFLLTLTIYNLGYALPFLLVPLSVAMLGDRCWPVLEKINTLLVGLVDRILPVVLLLLGIALIADAVSYFAAGEGLW